MQGRSTREPGKHNMDNNVPRQAQPRQDNEHRDQITEEKVRESRNTCSRRQALQRIQGLSPLLRC